MDKLLNHEKIKLKNWKDVKFLEEMQYFVWFDKIFTFVPHFKTFDNYH